MALEFVKPEQLSLKSHSEFSEKWVQDRIAADPSILGLGDVVLIAKEKSQPKAGRLDLLLHDEQLNRRYEVELMLGATDPSHIIRSIEYFDIERRRYPAYNHVAVLIAEDITSRFLNVMALLAGSIPLIAIQFTALRVENKILLHFTRVLDQTELRTDDTYEGGDTAGAGPVDRSWWEQKTPPQIMAMCDEVLKMTTTTAKAPHRLQYRKNLINVVRDDGGTTGIWLWPRKTLLNIGAYVEHPANWAKQFEDLEATLRRGNRAVRIPLTPEVFEPHRSLLLEFLHEALDTLDGE